MLRVGLPASLEIESRIDEAPVLVYADPNQIHQVLMNLGTNAAYAMRSMPGAMTVTVDRVGTKVAKVMTVSRIEPGVHARIVVEDRGEGIDEGILTRLFEPFFTTKQNGEGSGLGLAVVHGIVRDHHGALDVSSRRGEGTRVSVYLPLHEGSATESVEPAAGAEVHGRGERVLFVDDEEAIGNVCGSLLSRGGYQVAVFKSPVEALARFSCAPDDFDIVITDLAMPRMSGEKLAQEVLALRPDIPVLMITGNSAGLTRQRLRDLGVSDLLQKPMTRQALTTAVRRALDGLA